MATSEIHIGDVGTAIRATIKDEDDVAVDVSAATTKQLIFEKPDCTEVTKTATFYTDGTDGIIQYLTETSFLNMAGVWRVQAYIVLSGGEWKTDIYEFRVYKNIGD